MWAFHFSTPPVCINKVASLDLIVPNNWRFCVCVRLHARWRPTHGFWQVRNSSTRPPLEKKFRRGIASVTLAAGDRITNGNDVRKCCVGGHEVCHASGLATSWMLPNMVFLWRQGAVQICRHGWFAIPFLIAILHVVCCRNLYLGHGDTFWNLNPVSHLRRTNSGTNLSEFHGNLHTNVVLCFSMLLLSPSMRTNPGTITHNHAQPSQQYMYIKAGH